MQENIQASWHTKASNMTASLSVKIEGYPASKLYKIVFEKNETAVFTVDE